MTNPFKDWTLAEVDGFNARHGKKPVKIVDAAPPETRESALHERIIAVCRANGWIYRRDRMDMKTSGTIGWPDFTILASAGRTFLIECKTAKGKLTTQQAGLAMKAESLGHTVHVVRSMSEFYNIIYK